MKKSVLVLLALFTLVPFAQAMAQTPTPAPAPVVDAATAQFLATLAGGQTQAPSDLMPTPLFTQTGCSTDADCPTGQLCCVLCGTIIGDVGDGGDTSGCLGCVTPRRPMMGCPPVQ